jgi:hypothetical protein
LVRKEKAGIMMADSLIEWAHMMYNHNTAKGVITSVIKQLQKRLGEYVPVKEANNVFKR